MEMALLFILFLIGYLFGNIQSAYLVARKFGGIDIREHGSGNAGASNVTSTLGFRKGAIVGVIDFLKAYLPVVIARHFLDLTTLQLIILGTGVVIGHIYPVVLGFRGGKGVASLIGIGAGLSFPLGLLMFVILALVTVISNYIFLGSIILYTVLPLYILIYKYDQTALVIALLLLALGIFKHRGNISRLINGEETGLKETISKHRKVK